MSSDNPLDTPEAPPLTPAQREVIAAILYSVPEVPDNDRAATKDDAERGEAGA